MKKLALLGLFAFVHTNAHAYVVEVSNSDSGWYNNSGYSIPENTNYFAGTNTFVDPTRNFFVFDLGNISDTVTSATFQLFTYSIPTGGGSYSLYDVTTSISSLTEGGNQPLDIYNDLGSGVNYGEIFLSTENHWQYIEIELNSDAISAINSAGGLFAVGGSYSPNQDGAYAFGGSDFNVDNKLILNTVSVPEPSGIALVGAGFIGLAAARLKRKFNQPINVVNY